MSARFISFVLLFTSVITGFAQSRPEVMQVPAKMITVDDGLPQGMVWSILQDSTGFLWFATKDGLVRYDGYEYRVFRHDPKDPLSLAESNVTDLYEDTDGSIWIGMESAGVDRYDPRTGTFQHFGWSAGGRIGERVRELQQDGTGTLWLRSGKTLYLVPGGTDDVTAGKALIPVCDRYPELPCQNVWSFRFSDRGLLWLAGDHDVSVWAMVNGHFELRSTWHSPWRPPHKEFLPGLIERPSHGDMLYVFNTHLARFDGLTYLLKDTFLLAEEQLIGNGLIVDAKDRLWGTGPKGSIMLLDPEDGHVAYVMPTNESKEPYWLSAICCRMIDRANNILLGTGGYGILKMKCGDPLFHRYPIDEEHLKYSTIVRTDAVGEDLFDHMELRRLNGPSGQVGDRSITEALKRQGIEPSWGISAKDPRGEHWMGGWTGKEPIHLFRFNVARNEAEQITSDDSDVFDATYPGLGEDVWAINTLDRKNHKHQLVRIDSRSAAIVSRHDLPGPARMAHEREVSCWRIAADSSLWMSTTFGVYAFQPRTGQWRAFRHDPKDPASLPDASVLSLCFDPQDPLAYIWVGTEGSGMHRVDMHTGKVTRSLTAMNGLPNDVVYGILPDDRGNLWISTNNGLCWYDPRSGDTRTYTKEDGIAGNEFNRYSAEKSADGRLFFGGMEGVTFFDPEDAYKKAPASNTVITQCKLLNEPISFSARPDLLSGPIDRARELVLPYSERMITFGFACMDQSLPYKNAFRYKLEGLNKGWIENGASHEATFTNLDPGKYTFKVQGRNSEGVWDTVGASIGLRVTPPWWGTWWFRSLMVLVFVFALYALYRYRLKKALELARVRDRIARDLHDEIGSTLSSVALYSAVAKKKAGDRAPEASEMLGRITESTTSVMEAMNDIVWAVNTENDDMDHVVQRMRAYAVQMTEAGQCILHFEVDTAIAGVPIGMSERKNLYLIFKEAVNNAMKYAQCTTLNVGLERQGRVVALTVADDGIGFDPDAPHENHLGGNGLGNIRKRAEDLRGTLIVRSSPGKGTQVELRFHPGAPKKSLDHMIAKGRPVE